MTKRKKGGNVLFSCNERYMKVKVFMRWDTGADKKQTLRCICLREGICLQEAARCNRHCEKDVVEYDQYRSLYQCFKNRDEDKYK